MKTVGDVVNVGDQVKVKVIGMDDRGKVKLSMKAVDQKTGEDIKRQGRANTTPNSRWRNAAGIRPKRR